MAIAIMIMTAAAAAACGLVVARNEVGSLPVEATYLFSAGAFCAGIAAGLFWARCATACAAWRRRRQKPYDPRRVMRALVERGHLGPPTTSR